MRRLKFFIALTVAQQNARQRENKTFDANFSYDFNFGNDYGIVDAFNDFNFGSTVEPTVFDAYDGAEELKPIRPVVSDEVKSNFVVDTGDGTAETNLFGDSVGLGAATNEVQDFSTIDIEINNGENAQRCFVGSSASSNVNADMIINQGGIVADWFTNGVWDICDGENDTCEIKVIRSNDIITQVHSKCANRHSCVDNMRQNFNPQAATPDGNGFAYRQGKDFK